MWCLAYDSLVGKCIPPLVDCLQKFDLLSCLTQCSVVVHCKKYFLDSFGNCFWEIIPLLAKLFRHKPASFYLFLTQTEIYQLWKKLFIHLNMDNVSQGDTSQNIPSSNFLLVQNSNVEAPYPPPGNECYTLLNVLILLWRQQFHKAMRFLWCCVGSGVRGVPSPSQPFL